MRNQIFEEMVSLALAMDNQYKDEDIADIVHFSQTWD